MEGAVAENDDAVRIAHERVGAELRQFGNPGKPVFVNLVPKVDRPFATGAQCDHKRQQIDGEVRPRRGFDFRQEVARERRRDAERLVAADDSGGALVFDDHAEFGEGAGDEVEVMRERMLDAHFAAGDRAEGEEGNDLVVVGPDGDGGTVEPFHAGDFEAAGAEAFDLGAHRNERGAELLHVRLAGGVDERGRAGGESGGHGEILRDSDRHVVAPVTGAGEAVGEGEDERFAFVNDGAQGAEDFEVGVDLADSERAAFGVGADGEFAETMEQGGVQ